MYTVFFSGRFLNKTTQTGFVVTILLETFIQFRNKNADKKKTRATFANNSLGTRLRGRMEHAAPGPQIRRGLLPLQAQIQWAWSSPSSSPDPVGVAFSLFKRSSSGRGLLLLQAQFQWAWPSPSSSAAPVGVAFSLFKRSSSKRGLLPLQASIKSVWGIKTSLGIKTLFSQRAIGP